MSPEQAEKPFSPLWVLFWRLVLSAHLAVAAGWMWLMPGGFPWGHPRFWANRALPLAIILGAAAP